MTWSNSPSVMRSCKERFHIDNIPVQYKFGVSGTLIFDGTIVE